MASIQSALNKLRIRDNNGDELDEDGIIGVHTMYAIQKFQQIAGIGVDGIAGPITLSAMNSVLQRSLLSVGSSNRISVRYLQWRLGVGIDGAFGQITEEGVINFQENKGISADGIVGNMTWSKLLD